MKRALFCLLAFAVVLLNSCIDGEEEVFIEANGSARVKAVYRVPGLLFSAEDAEELKTNIAEEIAEEKNLRLITNRVETENGSRVITIEIETSDLLELEDTLVDHTPGVKQSKADKMLHAILGSISVNLSGLKAGLTRDIDIGPLLDEHLGKSSASILGDSQFRYIVHLPKAAEKSNAHVVENDGRTLKWAFKLSECHKKPISMSMVAPIPLPWWVYGASIVALLLLAWGAWKLVALKSRRSQ